MTTPQVLMTKARIINFLARIKASKARHGTDMERAMPTAFRPRMTRQEQRT